VEIVPELAARAAATLRDVGVANVHLRTGDGRSGWPEEAPFDRVLVTAAAERIPDALVAQLAPGGRLVIPVGRRAPHDEQVLMLVTRDPSGALEASPILPVRFVPLTGGGAPPSA
jgi:protein-L-isoaspartate(D-aspartate) O-methyltransferase